METHGNHRLIILKICCSCFNFRLWRPH